MNIYDVICMAILVIFILSGSVKGLVRSAFGILSSIASMYLTYTFFPAAVRLLRVCGVYAVIKEFLEQTMNLEGLGPARQAQTEFINNLPQSSFILGHLHANNNKEAYHVLDVSNLSDYITGYFANMAVNLIAIICLFIVIRLLLSIALNALNILTRLPVLNQLNKFGGAVFGLAQGLLFIWIALCVMTFFFLFDKNADLFHKIKSGVLSGFFYNWNPIMNIVVMLIPNR